MAEAEIIRVPEPRAEDPEAVPFWRGNNAAATEIVPRAQLRLMRRERDNRYRYACGFCGSIRSAVWKYFRA
jgi:hypothetical protein